MIEITIEEIQKKLESLPEELRWAIMEARVDDNILEIGRLNSLSTAQIGQLALETSMVMLGFIEPHNFQESLNKSLGLPEEKVRILVEEVNEKILRKIREKMMSMYSDEDEEEEDSAPALDLPTVPISRDVGQGSEKNDQKIFVQKLAGSFKAPVKKTEYTLNNLSKGAADHGKNGSVQRAASQPTQQPPTPQKPDSDPYREMPE